MPADTPRRGLLGGARPDADPEDRAPTPGSLKQADVDERDNVGSVTPEDYPAEQRAKLDAGELNRGRRAGKGSGPATGSGAGAGGKGNEEDYDSDPQGGGGDAEVRTDRGPKTGADAPVGGSR